MNEVVQDLIVFVSFVDIDGIPGPGSSNTLGQGGGCWLRAGSFHPLVGQVLIDRADLVALEAAGQLEETVLHELMHVLGVGTTWGPQHFGLLRNPSRPNSPGVDTYFAGLNAATGFLEIGGAGYSGGQRVPVENTALPQADTHWRTSVVGAELMQPFLVFGRPAKLSRLTLRSLQDLGYSVDLSEADPFTIPPPSLSTLLTQPRGGVVDDIAKATISIVDNRGRVVRVIPPQ
jgi:hypothetical protein